MYDYELAAKQAERLYKRLSITCKSSHRVLIPNGQDRIWTSAHYASTYEFCFNKKYVHTSWHEGLDIMERTPDYTVLACLCRDAQYAKRVSFEEFCEELGYDTDSRRIFAMFKHLRNKHADLELVFPVRIIEIFAKLAGRF